MLVEQVLQRTTAVTVNLLKGFFVVLQSRVLCRVIAECCTMMIVQGSGTY